MSIALDFSDMFRQAPEQRGASVENDPPETNCSEENDIPQTDSSDLHSWVKNTLKSMNCAIKDEDLAEGSLLTWQRLLSERLHWQNQSQSVIEENISLRRKYENLDREKNLLKSQVENLQQDISGVHSKMAAMQEDQRQLRCHWLAEKTELETRCFQAQGLATQYQGTIRKKDKDYEKLQGQLAKMVKDSSRGQKSVIVITKPLPKNFQERPRTLDTLKDVELTAARATGSALEAENTNLRTMFNALTTSFEEVQRKLAMNNINAMMEQQTKFSSLISTPAKDEACSPLARPYQSVVKQAASSAKEAERLSMSPQRSAGEAGGDETVQKLQQALDEIRNQLHASQAVIAEQGTLIHAALLGKLPGLSEATEAFDDTENVECDMTFDEDLNFLSSDKSESDDTIFHMRDFLSPASPATMALLGSAGAFWSPAVPQSSSKKR